MAMKQSSRVLYMQGSSTAGVLVNGNGVNAETDGFNGAISVEVSESAGGTCTVALQGSVDGVTWYVLGYQRVDNQATLTRAVANISVTASLKAVFQVLDAYPLMRAVVSAVAGGCNVTVRAYCVPD